MATHDAASTTLRDLGVDPGVVAREHTPTLYPGERFVRCRTCGASVPFAVTAEGPIRRALEELTAIECGRAERPDEPVGEHVPTITPEHPDGGRRVVCESCGRAAPLGDDRERVLRELADVPCVDGLSYTELVDLVFSPTSVTPSLAELGIQCWYGRPGRHHAGDVTRVFRHERSQYAAYVVANDDGTYSAAVTGAPSPAAEPVAELRFPGADPADPATRKTAVTFVTFLAATDGLSAGDVGRLRAAYEDAYESHRTAWLQGAYDRAREKFRERYAGSPEAFAEAFADSVADAEEALRRLVSSGGFEDVPEGEFARETLGRDHGFPGFVDFVADRCEWSPPLPEA